MRIALRILRDMIVQYVSKSYYIDPTSSDISSYEDRCLLVFEFFQYLLSLTLSDITMDLIRWISSRLEVVGDVVTLSLGPTEHDRVELFLRIDDSGEGF